MHVAFWGWDENIWWGTSFATSDVRNDWCLHIHRRHLVEMWQSQIVQTCPLLASAPAVLSRNPHGILPGWLKGQTQWKPEGWLFICQSEALKWVYNQIFYIIFHTAGAYRIWQKSFHTSRFNPFYQKIKSQLLGTQYVFQHFHILYLKFPTHLKLWVAVTRHSFRCVKNYIR